MDDGRGAAPEGKRAFTSGLLHGWEKSRTGNPWQLSSSAGEDCRSCERAPGAAPFS